MSNKVNLALQIIPKSTAVHSYDLVDVAIDTIRKSGLNFLVCPFETVIEGTYKEVMQVAEQAKEACFAAGATDVLVYMKLQESKSEDIAFDDKIAKHRV